jgi:hypothetical protein
MSELIEKVHQAKDALLLRRPSKSTAARYIPDET